MDPARSALPHLIDAIVAVTVDGRRLVSDFGRHTDGSIRCLPIDARIAGFADSQCTVPIAIRPKVRCGTPQYARSSRKAACIENEFNRPTYEEDSQVRELGQPITPTSVYSRLGSTCRGSSPSPNLDYFEVGSVVPASTFVEGTEVYPSVTERIAMRTFVGSDGSQRWAHPWSRDTHTRCSLRSGQCLPPSVALSRGLFTDAQCSSPLAEIAQGDPACPVPTLVRTNFSSPTYFEVGEPFGASTIYEDGFNVT